MLAPVKSYPAQDYTAGRTLITVDLPRFMPTVKSLNYISAIRGQQRARAEGAVEALYCTADGILSECTTSNLFVFFGDQLVTPNVDVLPGITRGVALELAKIFSRLCSARFTMTNWRPRTKSLSPAPPKSSCPSCASTNSPLAPAVQGRVPIGCSTIFELMYIV